MQPFNDGRMLEGMYNMKLDLMDRYHEKEMIPIWGIEYINDPRYQTFIKKLIGWVGDELTELSVQNKESIDLLYEQGIGKAQEKLTLYTLESIMELSDVIHFMVELMIFSEITAEDINAYYLELMEERNIALAHATDGLTSTLNYGMHTNNFDDEVRPLLRVAATISLSDKLFVTPVHFKLSQEVNMLKEICMWDMYKALSSAGRELKHKTWSLAKDPVDILQYKRKLMVAWLFMGKLLDLHQLDPKSTYHFFEKATIKNNNRIDNGY